MNTKLEEFFKILPDASPISITPSRYDFINIVFNEKQIKEDANNILKIIPVANSMAVRVSKSKPYIITATLLDASSRPTNLEIQLVFFAGSPSWWNRLFPLHTVSVISGKPKTLKNIISFIHPKKIENHAKYFTEKQPCNIEAIYKKHGIKITDAEIQQQMLSMAKNLRQLPDGVLKSINFHLGIDANFTLFTAITEIHRPSSIQKLEEAKKFLATLEYISYKYTLQKINHHKATPLVFEKTELQKILPYQLTGGQISAMLEIEKFQQNSKGKLFLLQGDVGCGKTIVAINSAINAVNAGFQVVILAPTQILAMQLFHNFNEILSHFNIACTLLTSKDSAKQKKAKLEGIQSGEVQAIIGTHAVFAKAVHFKNLGFVIIDEQHKFGVSQRLELMRKSQDAKCLLMTATPIPRTLSMSMYSGIEYYSIREKPQDRLPIKTSVLPVKKSGDILSSAKNRFGNDFKMYWVCPLIDTESEMKSNIKEREKFLLKYFKPEEIISVHGKMKEDAINNAILSFKNDQSARILLATTIVEVGIDVPQANIIVIESAETFGLASLHQLRGRVGRNSQQAYCILLFGDALSPTAITRLQAMKESSDGFYISEVDRKLRGSGNILGNAQSGSMCFTFFDETAYQNSIIKMEEVLLSTSNPEVEEISRIFASSTAIEFSFN